MSRDLIFVSHANPEDNVFTLWLALQLAKNGYPVWTDLTKLLGGEDFWSDIDGVIRNRTSKFLYVLSRTSNRKTGPLRELQVADNVARDQKIADFIIPLHIDGLPYREIHILLASLNAISFEHGWAAGLAPLLQKLEQDGVKKSNTYNPNAVASWWRTNFSSTEGVEAKSEECISNWIPANLPDTIHVHTLTRHTIGDIKIPANLPYPGFQQGPILVSFAQAEDFKGCLGECEIEQTSSFDTLSLFGENPPAKIGTKKQARETTVKLLGMAWAGMIRMKSLPVYELSNDRRCFYFSKGLVGTDDWVRYIDLDGEPRRRQMSGYKTIRHADRSTSKRYWHFGIQAYPIAYPQCAFVITPHVVFSDDGIVIWASKKKLHRARRSQCSNWWNDIWRDRILASLYWLGQDGCIDLPAGSMEVIRMSTSPVKFLSPFSYQVGETSDTIAESENDLDEDINEDQYDDEPDEV